MSTRGEFVLFRHSALDEVYAIDVFSPPRWDWVNKTDAYLRDAKK